jgi:hypothetical protein
LFNSGYLITQELIHCRCQQYHRDTNAAPDSNIPPL